MKVSKGSRALGSQLGFSFGIVSVSPCRDLKPENILLDDDGE